MVLYRITLKNLKGCNLDISLILTVIYSQELSRRISINKNTETQQDIASIHTCTNNNTLLKNNPIFI
jgi:hypothetical protein